jgi:hypothetical protein
MRRSAMRIIVVTTAAAVFALLASWALRPPPKRTHGTANDLSASVPGTFFHFGTVKTAVFVTGEVPRLHSQMLSCRALPPVPAAIVDGIEVRIGRAIDERAAHSAERAGSYWRPYEDALHDVAGWDIYDAKRRKALLVLAIAERTILLVWQLDATSSSGIKAFVSRLDFTQPLRLARQLELLEPG